MRVRHLVLLMLCWAAGFSVIAANVWQTLRKQVCSVFEAELLHDAAKCILREIRDGAVDMTWLRSHVPAAKKTRASMVICRRCCLAVSDGDDVFKCKGAPGDDRALGNCVGKQLLPSTP